MSRTAMRLRSIFDRVFGRAEEVAGLVIVHEDLHTAGQIREERGELEAEEAAKPGGDS